MTFAFLKTSLTTPLFVVKIDVVAAAAATSEIRTLENLITGHATPVAKHGQPSGARPKLAVRCPAVEAPEPAEVFGRRRETIP